VPEKDLAPTAANVDRIEKMNKKILSAETIFETLGQVQWDGNDAFVVITKQRVKLVLCPNTGLHPGVPKQVIIDEISVPENLRRKGNASKAMTALCRLADKYSFDLLGGPIGFSENPWREKFVEWVLSFGFKRDSSPHLKAHDPRAFYVIRVPGD
jgi:hypothetical protein